MNLHAICHIPKSSYAYAHDINELHLRLRTAKGDCGKVTLVISQKHRWEQKERFDMQKIATDSLFEYYQYNFFTDDPRLGYYFEIESEGKTTVYSESGFSDSFDDENAYFHYFQYPYINESDVHRIPDWLQNTVFYQIFVERFCNGNPKNDPKNISSWSELPNPKSFFGGDLQGIINKLDYLTELGITGLYLTPVFQSPSNHKYDTTDYHAIDSAFGDKKLLCELVKKAHLRGIRVILDGVFNHSGYDFALFQDVIKNGEKSKYRDWFYIDDFSQLAYKKGYRCFGTSPTMPKLNTANPETKQYLLDTVRRWTSETGIDGWRLDVSDEIDHGFWRDFRKVVKGINSEAVIIGENWHNAYPWLMGDQFDCVMNYPVTKSCIEFFATGKLTAEQFAENLSSCLMWNSDQVNLAMLNLLDSHDTVRFLTWCGGSKEKLMLAVLFLHTYVGAPCTYYGSEIGTEGNGDPDCRRTFDWNSENWDTSLREYYKSVISLRRRYTALRTGSVRLYTHNEIFISERACKDEMLLTAINNTPSERQISLNSDSFNVIFSTTNAESLPTLMLPPYSAKVYLRV